MSETKWVIHKTWPQNKPKKKLDQHPRHHILWTHTTSIVHILLKVSTANNWQENVLTPFGLASALDVNDSVIPLKLTPCIHNVVIVKQNDLKMLLRKLHPQSLLWVNKCTANQEAQRQNSKFSDPHLFNDSVDAHILLDPNCQSKEVLWGSFNILHMVDVSKVIEAGFTVG
jgi:hypothetical protein